MRRWSNDHFSATPHGIINESGTDRYSIAYFHSPNPDAVIECPPTCTGTDNLPATRRLFTETLFHQKGHRFEAAARAVGAVA